MWKQNKKLKIILYFAFLCWLAVNYDTYCKVNDVTSQKNPNEIKQILNKTITLKVLLVEFQDVKHRNLQYPSTLSLPAYTYNDFNNMFFSVNKYCSPNMYSPDGKEVFGSLRDYFSIMSDGNLELTGYILNEDLNKDNVPDWIMLDNIKEYYNAERGKIFRAEAKQKAKSLGLDIQKDDETFLVIIYAGHIYRSGKSNSLNPEAFTDEHEYIMGERFASCYPYIEERDDSSLYPVAHFAHMGIHAHEFCHLLGFKDLLGGCDNEYFCLMSKGCFNGPGLEGSCPAPINPYFRWVLGWNALKIINESITKEIKYNLKDSDIYKIQDSCSLNFFLVEFRQFNSKMKLGDHLIPDYNSHIKNVSQNNGILMWRKLTGNYVMLMHSCGNLCSNCNHFMFPGENNIRVINPWSDCRQSRCGYYWVPNTKPTSNCGIEIVECTDDHYVVDFYQKYPENTSPSTPRNIELFKDNQVKLSWSQNSEPDFAYYKVYKKVDHEDYKLYDTVSISSYTDSMESMSTNADTYGYAYYKITSFDLENKESTFSKEIKVPIRFNLTTNIGNETKLADGFILQQNYPNPFNPSTTIKYKIPAKVKNEKTNGLPASGLVILSIYNILGSEVVSLVNQKKEQGIYEVSWDASNQPSGVYFYKLTVGNYVETKKMILLK